ncbi:hypothetical protein DFA_10785 [Cavenderia fasciculata]|uniref:Uncharacterized protein n=1 Tax=Cavenderia fasciculata TaxID=261658 RepID=F4QBE0_CACFS|nr:uncharacterized protein DFA_10785 [Cavenderia fasciculata]EGG14912.1 hypothetical protein DFA_10785 [Cavenderia fasciculata]|eukprot:XP_004351428.1 hypothetical protein DFA_10785 [Cavenderia fasciculata]
MTTSTSSTGPVAPQRRDLTLFVHYRNDVTKISFNNVADHDDLRPIIRANPEFVIPRGTMLLFAEPPSNDNNAPARVPLDPLAAVTLADGVHLYVEVEASDTVVDFSSLNQTIESAILGALDRREPPRGWIQKLLDQGVKTWIVITRQIIAWTKGIF